MVTALTGVDVPAAFSAEASRLAVACTDPTRGLVTAAQCLACPMFGGVTTIAERGPVSEAFRGICLFPRRRAVLPLADVPMVRCPAAAEKADAPRFSLINARHCVGCECAVSTEHDGAGATWQHCAFPQGLHYSQTRPE